MDINETKAFQEKLDDILKDTETFVTAAAELRNTRLALEEYIREAEKLNQSLEKTAQKCGEFVASTSANVDGEFVNKMQKVQDDALTAIDLCVEQADILKEKLDQMAKTGWIVTLNQKCDKILEHVETTHRIGKSLYKMETENTEKLDKLLGLLIPSSPTRNGFR